VEEMIPAVCGARPLPPLQWSHKLSLVNGKPGPRRPICDVPASMESPAFTGEWLVQTFGGGPTALLLQWSHQLSLVNGRGMDAITQRLNELQWSHQLSLVNGSSS